MVNIPLGLYFMKLKKIGIEFIEAFGMSEGVGFTYAVPKDNMIDWPWEKLLDYYNTAGLPGPFVEVKIVDGNGNLVPKNFNTMGEILLKSPGITEGYWKDQEKTESSWTDDGWFKTGDLGVWNEDGYILILDRAKDVIKSGGEWISTTRLEDMISSHPAVSKVAVIGVKSKKWSERPLAVVVLKGEYKGKIKEDEIKDYLMNEFVNKGKMAKWWLPDKIVFVDELPLTSVGKLNKRALRENFKEIELP
jgi:fatty-acyl-CoA synthase